jgi:hypothetical protein
MRFTKILKPFLIQFQQVKMLQYFKGQGVLEHLKVINSYILCEIRRKRCFFVKLREQNNIKKITFKGRIPLLVLKGDVAHLARALDWQSRGSGFDSHLLH